MSITALELRTYCHNLSTLREEELKKVLEEYFKANFIEPHRPWRAVVGNKKCKPIPIYRSFSEDESAVQIFGKFKWPNFSEEALRETLKKLGFFVTDERISIAVFPETERKLTFAQEWVRKINYSYSQYCAKKKDSEDAKKIYLELLKELYRTSPENIITYKDYTFFPKFEFKKIEIEKTCTLENVRKLMADDGIFEVHDENEEYQGIKVLNSIPIN